LSDVKIFIFRIIKDFIPQARSYIVSEKEKVLKNYDVVRGKIISAGWIWWQEQEQIRKQKETIENTLQIHLKYQNGLEKDFPSWEKAKSEIISGKKKKCWIWYVF
jgi:hypothetical protein